MINASEEDEVQIGNQLMILGSQAGEVWTRLLKVRERLDGQSLSANRRIVALTDSKTANGMEAASLNPIADWVVLNLKDPAHARISHEVICLVFWVSETDPGEIVGPLLEGFQGIYFRRNSEPELVFQMGGTRHVFSLRSGENQTMILAFAASLALLSGTSAGVLQEYLNVEPREGSTKRPPQRILGHSAH